jgi:hypothetical protein
MSFTFHSTRGGRNRRKKGEQWRNIVLIVAGLVLLSGLFYFLGGENVRSTDAAYKQQALKLQEEHDSLEQTIISLRRDVKATQMRYQKMEERLKNEVPDGDLKMLVDVLRRQLNAGIKAERLASLLEATLPPKNCTQSQMKRFVVKTPVYSGPHGSVAFGNGAIVVSGEGESATGASGAQEAWYDPGKPVKLIFSMVGGKEVVKEGLLPIQYSTVVSGREYRFTVAAGERSFISVTSDNCDYP